MNSDCDDDFMGAIKIKDGLFIGDEFSAQVSIPPFFVNFLCFVGFGIHRG